MWAFLCGQQVTRPPILAMGATQPIFGLFFNAGCVSATAQRNLHIAHLCADMMDARPGVGTLPRVRIASAAPRRGGSGWGGEAAGTAPASASTSGSVHEGDPFLWMDGPVSDSPRPTDGRGACSAPGEAAGAHSSHRDGAYAPSAAVAGSDAGHPDAYPWGRQQVESAAAVPKHCQPRITITEATPRWSPRGSASCGDAPLSLTPGDAHALWPGGCGVAGLWCGDPVLWSVHKSGRG